MNIFGLNLSTESALVDGDQIPSKMPPQDAGSESPLIKGQEVVSGDAPSMAEDGVYTTVEDISVALDGDALDIKQDQELTEQVEEEIANSEHAIVSLESFIENIKATCDHGPGVNVFHMALAVEHCEAINRTIGFPDGILPKDVLSTESFSSPANVSLTTESVMAKAKESIIKLIDMVLKGIAWLLDKGKAIYSKLFNTLPKLREYVSKLEEISRDLPNGPPKVTTYKNAMHAVALSAEGKIITIADAISRLKGGLFSVKDTMDIIVGSGVFSDTEKVINELNKEVTSDEPKEDFKNMSLEEAMKAYDERFAIRGFINKFGVKGYTTVSKNDPNAEKIIKRVVSTLSIGHEARSGLHSTVAALAGAPLPRNKRLVVVLASQISNFYFKAYEHKLIDDIRYKVENHREINVEGRLSISNHLENILDLIKDFEGLQAGISKLEAIAKRLKNLSEVLRKNVMNSVKETYHRTLGKYSKDQEKAQKHLDVLDANDKIKIAISNLKVEIKLCNQPFSQFLQYGIFEMKSLLDICKYQMSLYGASGKEKPAEA